MPRETSGGTAFRAVEDPVPGPLDAVGYLDPRTLNLEAKGRAMKSVEKRRLKHGIQEMQTTSPLGLAL